VIATPTGIRSSRWIRQKRILIFALLGLSLLLAGSFIAVDWMIFLFGIKTIYAGVAKPVLSLICLALVCLIGSDGIDQKDTTLLLIAFVCIVPVDVLMSVVVFSSDVGVDSPAFMIGGALSILAHLLLIIRHGRGFPYFRSEFRRRRGVGGLRSFVWLPLLVYGACALALMPLLEPMIDVGHAGLGLIYSAFVATSMWIGWETVRFRLYARPNAWMIAIAMTCWFATEITGEIYNVQIGLISDILFNWVWVFYGTTILCLALSGYSWGSRSV
jgi:hypothetical protein